LADKHRGFVNALYEGSEDTIVETIPISIEQSRSIDDVYLGRLHNRHETMISRKLLTGPML
jgi:hypothetical protein